MIHIITNFIHTEKLTEKKMLYLVTHTHNIYSFSFQLSEPFTPRISNSMTDHTHNHILLIKYFLDRFHFFRL